MPSIVIVKSILEVPENLSRVLLKPKSKARRALRKLFYDLRRMRRAQAHKQLEGLQSLGSVKGVSKLSFRLRAAEQEQRERQRLQARLRWKERKERKRSIKLAAFPAQSMSAPLHQSQSPATSLPIVSAGGQRAAIARRFPTPSSSKPLSGSFSSKVLQ